MTDYLLKDFSWDEKDMVDREPAEAGNRRHFGHLQLFVAAVTKSFEAGHFITIPGVVGGQYQERADNGLMKFKGWTEGGDRRLFAFVATKKDKDGKPYQIVKQYKNKPDRKDEPHIWGDFVWPALMKLTKEERDKLLAGCPAEWEEIPTGHKAKMKDQDTGVDKEADMKAWVNFKIHTEESLKKAESEFFAQFSGNGAAVPVDDFYPLEWRGYITDMLKELARLLQTGESLDAVCAKTFLTDANGLPKVSLANGVVDVKAVLMAAYKVVDMPEPLKANILAKVEGYQEKAF